MLDWGIGHASRSIPIIRHLQKMNCEALIAANGGAKSLLKQYFPDALYLELPSVTIKYSHSRWLGLKLLLQMPSFILGIFKENKVLQVLIEKHNIDGIISDNRFGCWSNKAPSVYLTHQVNLISPVFGILLSPLLTKMHHWIIRNYSECWIPDLPGNMNEGLAGKLSHPPAKGIESHYIGLLSRFEKPVSQVSTPGNYILAILSGPEPQRSILEKKILEELGDHTLKIVRGLPGYPNRAAPSDNVEWFNHASDELFASLVQGARHIICRSGYSTLMDLVCLGKSAHLIPTPGQTEQEYLAKHLSAAGLYSTQQQDEKIELTDNNEQDIDLQRFNLDKDLMGSTLESWLAKL